jgi:hypothetical protein
MKLLALLLLVAITGCATFGSKKLSGGSDHERAMAHGAFNRQIPYLRAQGFDVPDHRNRVKLYPNPNVGVTKLRSGRIQGILKDEGRGNRVIARAGAFYIEYARPATPEMFDHEVKHCILKWGGYHNESSAHDRRAFPEGGYIK